MRIYTDKDDLGFSFYPLERCFIQAGLHIISDYHCIFPYMVGPSHVFEIRDFRADIFFSWQIDIHLNISYNERE